MADFEYYTTKYTQPISTLSINLDCLVERAFKDTWETSRDQRIPVYVPFLQNSLNDFSYDIFYFIGRIQDLITELVLYVKPEKVILAISGCVPLYLIEKRRREFYSRAGPLTTLAQLTSPGTILTELLDKNLKEWIPKAQDGTCTIGRVNGSGVMNTETGKIILPKEVYYYHYTIPGEATLKIIQALHSPDFNQMTGAHIIYSPSSINRMLALSLFNPLPNILLAEQDYSKLLIVDAFTPTLSIPTKDYAVLLTLFYDSFLPKFTDKPISELVHLLNGLTLWFDDDLNLQNLQTFMSKVESNTTDYNIVFTPRGSIDEFIRITGSAPAAENWTADDISQMCADFFIMADWCCYYLTLHTVDWNVNYHYLYLPSTADLFFHNIGMSIVLGDGCNFHIYHQLLCLLDLRSKQYAPNIFIPILEHKSLISYLYPFNYKITNEGIPILPPVQMKLVKEAAKPYLTQNSWDRYDLVTHFQFIPVDPRSTFNARSKLGSITTGPR